MGLRRLWHESQAAILDERRQQRVSIFLADPTDARPRFVYTDFDIACDRRIDVLNTAYYSKIVSHIGKGAIGSTIDHEVAISDLETARDRMIGDLQTERVVPDGDDGLRAQIVELAGTTPKTVADFYAPLINTFKAA